MAIREIKGGFWEEDWEFKEVLWFAWELKLKVVKFNE